MSNDNSDNTASDDIVMADLDTRLLKLVQDGIPFTHSPFAMISEELGITEEEIVHRIEKLQENGFIRRFGASIGHRAIGITANAMCTWNVPDELVEEVGAVMAGFTEVTHCYERPRYPDWPYNLFTMVHSYTKEDCEYVAQEISRATGITDYQLLYSVREFKKTGVRL